MIEPGIPIEIKYTNTLDEIKKGFIGIYKKYSMKRSVLLTLAYMIAVVLGIDLIVKNPSSFTGYGLTVIGAAMIFMQWVRPFMVRNRLVRVLMDFNEETFTAKFYSDRIEIETEILEGETETVVISKFGVEKTDNPDRPVSDIAKPEKTIINVATEELFSDENSEMFRLYVNRGLVYIFPKRCLSEGQIDALRGYFSEKGI